MRLLCAQVTRALVQKGTARGFVVGRTSDAPKGRRSQHWRRVARVAQRARVRSGVPGAAGYSLVTGVRARHRARCHLLGDGGERAEIRDVNLGRSWEGARVARKLISTRNSPTK